MKRKHKRQLIGDGLGEYGKRIFIESMQELKKWQKEYEGVIYGEEKSRRQTAKEIYC